jgi:CMP-N,N'-diacetyllegionaminic acid synthase
VIDGRRILAVIPARGGSKAVPRKNIRPLGGRPLLAWTVDAARRAAIFDDIVVTTDDAEIQRVAIEAGAQAPFLRPAELATDTALAVPTVQHATAEMEARTGRYEYVAMLQPTSPLRAPEDLVEALSRLVAEGADGIISVVDVDNWHPMKMKRLVAGLLVDYEPPPVENPPRQSLPRVYMVNGALYAARRDVLVLRGSFKGDRCLGHVMPPERSVNIDSQTDFVAAEHFLREARVPPSNDALRGTYETIHAAGRERFFTFSTDDVTREVVAELPSWRGLRVFEAGCGTGETAAALAAAGADVLAVDYAGSAIDEARRRHTHPHLRFEAGDWKTHGGRWDVVVLQEVIEHLDDPRDALRILAGRLVPGGRLIVTCPSFVNVRGIVWMTLQVLLGVPMSLTDRHFIAPWQMEEWARELGLHYRWRTFRHGQAHGEAMRVDLDKRLRNALRDAKLDNSQVDRLLDWLERVGRYQPDAIFSGAKALYLFTCAS